MASFRITFKLTIMTPDMLVYENEVESVFLTGDHGEYELLPYHYPVLGILKPGNIIIDWKESVPIRSGIIRFFANDCIILIEPIPREKKVVKKEEELAFAAEEE
jgi:F0F1-type ATP synthase epsilon subunit